MGRVATGSYEFTCRRGVHGIRWKVPGTKRRPEVSLRTRDIVEARRIAPQVYAAHVTGATKDGGTSNFLADPTTSAKELIATWIASVKTQLGRNTDKTYIIYGKHWLKHIKVLGDVRSAKVGDYMRARLDVVLADTVKLELSALRRFFKWLREQEYIRAVPEFPEMGDKTTGTRYAVRRRAKPTEVFTPEQMDQIIEAMPEWSQKKVRGRLFPIRARFVIARLTGLRPITLDHITGRDLTVSGLHVRDENDKNRWGRVVPLTPRARAALESVMPEDPDELIFGGHEWDRPFEAAVLKVLGPDMADRMTPYDVKHGFVTEMFDAGVPETGIQFLTGTVSAIRQYSHPTRRAGEEALRMVFGGQSGDKPSGGHGEQLKTSPTVIKAGKSYQKPQSKNPGDIAVVGRKKARD